MHYLSFSAEDFALDASFRNYCVKANDADIHFWEQWIENNPSKKEEVWQAKQMVLLLSGGHSEHQLTADRLRFKEMMTKHLGNTFPDKPHASPVVKLRKHIFRAAVAIAAFAAITALGMLFRDKTYQSSYKTFAASKAGEKKFFLLADGTKVTLNAGSNIDISESFNKSTREIRLNGEAFFEVAHNKDKPFIIHTQTMNIKVLGTTFNVKAYAEDNIMETSLIEGSVEVGMNNSREKVILKPSEKIILPNKAAKENRVTHNENAKSYIIQNLTYDQTDSSFAEISWKESRLVFTDQSFEELAKTLERWYNIHVRFDDESTRAFRFTATFENKSIVQVLDALRLSRQFRYTIKENEIIIDK